MTRLSDPALSVRLLELRARQAHFKPAELARACGVSLRQLERIFEQLLHTSPSHWLRNQQCCLARELVLRGCPNKTVVAELCFASQSHFCREFRKAFGFSPRRFAKKPGYQPPMSLLDNKMSRLDNALRLKAEAGDLKKNSFTR